MRVDFGQGNLVEAFVRQRKSKDGWLAEIDRLVDWRRLEALFSDVYASREGGASHPILTYVKLLLLQQWHGLSDPPGSPRSLLRGVAWHWRGRWTTGCRFAGFAAFRSIVRCRIMRRSGGSDRSSPNKMPMA